MKMRNTFPILACAALAACSSVPPAGTDTATTTTTTSTKTEETVSTPAPAPAKEPDHIIVQHILIGFSGSVPGKAITRSKDEAKTLAYMVLSKAKAGDDFDSLVKEYTNDAFPGKYGMSNNGVSPDRSRGEYARSGMVGAFGNVGFKLGVGEIGIADYDPRTSPFGWHIIKRVE
jgi:hypothetical protein